MRAVQEPQQPEQTGPDAKRESGAILATLRDQAARLLAEGPYEVSDPVTPALQIVADLKPGELALARRAHEQLRDSIAEVLQLCGYVDEDLVPLVRGLKAVCSVEQWAYQDGGWRKLGEVAP